MSAAVLRAVLLGGIALLPGCSNMLTRLGEVGGPPNMTQPADPTKDPAWRAVSLPMPTLTTMPTPPNTLWRQGGTAFFRDPRAAAVGDIVTVLVNITDNADFQNSSTTTRTGSEAMGVPNLFGLENQMPKALPHSSPSNLVNTNSTDTNNGVGEVKRAETVTLSLAGVVTQVLPNGNLVVVARQQVRVNSELRELQVSGVVRPQDIASDNTVAHDRMAEARIAYGGRGQLTDIQTPRYGQQLMDILLPF
jgi:flagellar L-ring protein precursor FlgH